MKGAGGQGSPVPFLVPALLIVFAVLIFPIVFSFVVSLYDWPLSAGGGERRFVGAGNYVDLVQEKEFWNSLKLQLGFIFIAIPLELLLGLSAALLLNREFMGGKVDPGETPEEALAGVRKVVAEAGADLAANGESIPQALSEKHYSGEFRVRIPPELHRQLALVAAEQGVSLNRLASAKLAGQALPG